MLPFERATQRASSILAPPLMSPSHCKTSPRRQHMRFHASRRSLADVGQAPGGDPRSDRCGEPTLNQSHDARVQRETRIPRSAGDGTPKWGVGTYADTLVPFCCKRSR
jgi:hypothetical protein